MWEVLVKLEKGKKRGERWSFLLSLSKDSVSSDQIIESVSPPLGADF